MSLFRLPLQIAITCLGLWSAYHLGRSASNINDGFVFSRVLSDLTYNPDWDTGPISDEERRVYNAIEGQTFTYLGKGAQCYAFGSEDGEYVLKLIKFQHYRPHAFVHYLHYPPALDRYRQRRIRVKDQKLNETFQSYLLAARHLTKETGMISVHLNKTSDLNTHVTIADKHGHHYPLSLDDVEFMLQRRGERIYPTLDTMIANGKEAEAKRALTEIFEILVQRHRVNIVDLDPAFAQNYGISNEHTFQLDVGRFAMLSQPEGKHWFEREFSRVAQDVLNWVNLRHPEFLPHVKNDLTQFIAELEGEGLHIDLGQMQELFVEI